MLSFSPPLSLFKQKNERILSRLIVRLPHLQVTNIDLKNGNLIFLKNFFLFFFFSFTVIRFLKFNPELKNQYCDVNNNRIYLNKDFFCL